ncbi:MAG TPA: response regulator [Terriglobia bacterium]
MAVRSEIADILLVEDNPGDVRLIREAFKDSKVPNRLHVAENGVEALKFLRYQGGRAGVPRPDLILLDWNLPKKSGRELLEEVKSDSDLRTIPIVVLTTSKSEEDIVKAYGLHANCYITKPVDFVNLSEVLKSIEDFWLTVVKLPPKTP